MSLPSFTSIFVFVFVSVVALCAPSPTAQNAARQIAMMNLMEPPPYLHASAMPAPARRLPRRYQPCSPLSRVSFFMEDSDAVSPHASHFSAYRVDERLVAGLCRPAARRPPQPTRD